MYSVTVPAKVSVATETKAVEVTKEQALSEQEVMVTTVVVSSETVVVEAVKGQ